MKKTISYGLKKIFNSYGTEILLGCGIAGFVGSIILAIDGTKKADVLISREKEKKNIEELTAKETFKTVWKCYIPTVATSILSGACIILAETIHGKKTAAIATAYSLSENAFKEYQRKVIEQIGSEKEESIQREVREKIEEKGNSEVIVLGSEEIEFLEPITGRYFMMDPNKLESIVNRLNKEMLSEMSVSLNEFCLELGLNEVDIGYELGWNVNKGFIELYEHKTGKDPKGKPCLVLDYRIPPRYGFINF